eukprot:6213297-Pleurochrysis_carterae.AAC.6
MDTCSNTTATYEAGSAEQKSAVDMRLRTAHPASSASPTLAESDLTLAADVTNKGRKSVSGDHSCDKHSANSQWPQRTPTAAPSLSDNACTSMTSSESSRAHLQRHENASARSMRTASSAMSASRAPARSCQRSRSDRAT